MSHNMHARLGRRLAIVSGASLLLSCLPALAGEARLQGLDSTTTQQRFIIKYRSGSSADVDASALQRNLAAAVRSLPTRAGNASGLQHLRRLATGADVVKSDSPLDRADAETLIRKLAADPEVEYVEVDRLNTASFVPNDPRFSSQWGYTGSYGIKAPQAWDSANGRGVVVAVLDTGITRHSDLDANVLPGYDFVSDLAKANDGDGRDADPSDPGDWTYANQCRNGHGATSSSWHGTHVAGTIAAVTNNGNGVAGTAFGAKILPVRVLGVCGGYESDIADAVVWASGGTVAGVPVNSTPAEVINLSLGGPGACSITEQRAIDSAVARGTTVVVAAGNGNVDATLVSPASCNNVIAVGANDQNGRRSIWNTVEQSDFGAKVDLAAPGSDILSTINSGTQRPSAESYASYGGTSMATPHMAGVVALVQSVSNPARTPAQIRTLLKSTVTAFPVTPDKPIGTGIVNAQAAVAAALGGNAGVVAAEANGDD